MTTDELRDYLLQNLEATKLDLSDRGITELPPEIGRLYNLKVLYLDGNQLTALPPNIGNLAKLQTLDLRHNQLTSLPAELDRGHMRINFSGGNAAVAQGYLGQP
jgi:Leucine-rich repeat (LRR) protein